MTVANGYIITGQRGTQEIVSGRLMPAMEISVRTDDGGEKVFIVLETNYTKEKVTAIIDEWYERYRDIATI